MDNDDLEQVIKGTLDTHESLISSYLEAHAPKRKKKEKEKEKAKGFKAWTVEDFRNEVFEKAKPEYGQNMIDNFFRYYSEPDQYGNMKLSQYETWSTAGRLSTWYNRDLNKH